MTGQAIAKINAEMQKEPANRYLEILGHYVIDRCDGALAAEIAGGKTLQGAMEAVMKRAKRAKRGTVAVLAPDEVFGEVDKYFGLSSDPAAQWKAMGLPSAGAVPEPGPQTAGADIDLADFF